MHIELNRSQTHGQYNCKITYEIECKMIDVKIR